MKSARLPFWGWVLLIAGAIGVWINVTEVVGDNAFANLLTILLGLVTVLTLVVWFVVWSGRPRRTRMRVLAGAIVVPAVFLTLFRLEDLSGELIPHYAFRFAPATPKALPAIGSISGEVAAESLVDLAHTTPEDFPQFLGPHRDQTIEGTVLARDWAARPPRLVWKHEIGEGWSGFAVVNGFAVTMEQRDKDELTTCYEVATGKLRWLHAMPARYEVFVAGTGPRSTPAIDEGRVYSLGATGRLCCLDGARGESIWEQDLRSLVEITAEEESATLLYGRAGSPLVVDDLVVVTAGGPPGRPRASLYAFHKLTGELVWKGGDRNAGYASPILTELAGARQIVSVNEDNVSGHDPQTGKELWQFPWMGHSSGDANVSQPVPLPPDRLFVSKGYFRGAALIRLLPKADGTFEVEELKAFPKVLKTKFTNVVMHNGYVYGLSDGILECVELETGRSAWKAGRYGHGQILRVGDLLLVLAESGEVFLLELSPTRKNNVLGSIQAIIGKTWNTFALTGSKLLVRNSQEAACYDLPLETSAAAHSPP